MNINIKLLERIKNMNVHKKDIFKVVTFFKYANQIIDKNELITSTDTDHVLLNPNAPYCSEYEHAGYKCFRAGVRAIALDNNGFVIQYIGGENEN
jgi:hypothetical protein